jgi:4-hydroxy-tetrahydrodipicolinate synthase
MSSPLGPEPGAACAINGVSIHALDDVRSRLSGISAVPVTPFAPGGELDEQALGVVVRRIVEAGIELVVACGNTGEQASLTALEADRVTAVTIEGAGTATVIVGVGGDVRTAAAKAARATELGAAGVMVHFPTDPYLSDEGLVRYYSELASATEGVVVPYLRGQGVSTRVLDPLAELENVVAVKYSVPDVLAFAAFASRYGEAMIPICGLAELWAPFFWLAGARGFTSGLVNVFPRPSMALLEALRAGETEQVIGLWRAIEPFERLRAGHASANNVPVVKEAMAMLGLIGPTVRPPLAPLDESDRVQLPAILERLEAAS